MAPGCRRRHPLVPGLDHESVKQLMRLRGLVDVIIPRGGAGLIRSVVEESTVPVIETGVGNCHVYVDADADLEMALAIAINAKVPVRRSATRPRRSSSTATSLRISARRCCPRWRDCRGDRSRRSRPSQA